MDEEHCGRDVWITGIGLVSSLGADAEAHEAHFVSGAPPVVDETRYAPYAVHPLAPLEWSRQIPKNSDQRQMEVWQRIGVYAAGLALADAGLAGNPALLDHTDLVVAAGSGERDTEVDCNVLAALGSGGETALMAKEVLPSALRPTLFLAQLSNMLAGNISIVHHVTGSSRTFMGEEMAGFAAIENAHRRIAAGQADIILVGGALNAEREDLLLGYEIGHNLWRGPFRPVLARSSDGGGFIPGSVGAFLVLESEAHARTRGRTPHARLSAVVTDHGRRSPADITRSLARLFEHVFPLLPDERLTIWSGASGVEPATGEELAFLDLLPTYGITPGVAVYGDRIGHSVEAHFPAGVAMAALALRRESRLPAIFSPPQAGAPAQGSARCALVTGVGHWRGEALALIEAIS